MRRRGFVKALAAIPAAPALLAQQPPPPSSPAPASAAVRSPDDLPVLTPTPTDVAGEILPQFFSVDQFAALRRISDLLMPAADGSIGALDAHAPEFLDFLIGQSQEEKKSLYRQGLDALNAQSTQRFHKSFVDLDAAQADVLLAALRQPWTFEAPADPVAAFLREVRQDVRTATLNSREYNAANASSGARRFGGGGLYWLPLE